MEFSLVQADKNLFAIYQTIYSNVDIEMWFDWNKRLNDTKWTDQCYFLISDGQKVGGVIITDKSIMYPFLIPPFCDRIAFWKYILEHSGRDKINGILEKDAAILPMFDYKVDTVNQVMCRPADIIANELSDNFVCRSFNVDTEVEEVGKVIIQSYAGGICDEINGAATLASAIDDIKKILCVYSHNHLSHVIVEKATDKIVAVCLAGTGINYTHGYVEIADLCVLPQFRGMGLAKYMIGKIVTDSIGIAPFVKLFVYVGNNAEFIYHQMGFISGPRFINMSKRKLRV